MIKIMADLIQKVFQIPNGKIKIEEKLRPKESDLIIKFSCGQLNKELLKRMYTANVIRDLKKRNELGRMLKLNFLVIFFTVMAEAMQSSNVNQRFLPSMKSDIITQDFSWCEYILNVLRRTRRQWPENERTFNGPIGFLAV
ncbi:hypothetical protein HanHA300_Chr13g0485361 [Helianthus annuus]|nr:hypothetical protein HanHA300_Chr13g0485361 [Helianthus annuus]KAJ0849547.1 hypothetical protein HanPSC8_Chr13g0569941 [Helianthus annuus]